MQGVLSVSIVPKHIIISKLKTSIQIRQICNNSNNDDDNNNSNKNYNNINSNNDNSNSNNNNNDINIGDNKIINSVRKLINKNYSSITLLPGSVQNFHFPSKFNEKILQIRKIKEKKVIIGKEENNKNKENRKNNTNKNIDDGGEKDNFLEENQNNSDDDNNTESGTYVSSQKI